MKRTTNLAMVEYTPNLDGWRCVWHNQCSAEAVVALADRNWPPMYPEDNDEASADGKADVKAAT